MLLFHLGARFKFWSIVIIGHGTDANPESDPAIDAQETSTRLR